MSGPRQWNARVYASGCDNSAHLIGEGENVKVLHDCSNYETTAIWTLEQSFRTIFVQGSLYIVFHIKRQRNNSV